MDLVHRLVEAVYARGIYPPLARTLSTLTGWIPFSLAEWTFAAIPVLLCWAAVSGWRRRRLRGLLVRTLATAGATWLVFMALWGLNYLRPAPREVFRLGPPPRGRAAARLVARIARRLDRVRAGCPERPDGVVALPELDDHPGRSGRRVVAELDRHVRVLEAIALTRLRLPVIATGRAKVFLASPLLLRWGVSGTYGPFTGEPNLVWPAAPGLVPFDLAHERAHLAGLAAEEEASFVGLIACWASPRPEVRYSGWLALWLELRVPPAGLSPPVRRDLEAIRDFVRRHVGREAPWVRRVYSGYLRAHGVRGGIRSYGRVAGLALAWLDERGFPPEPLPDLPPPPPGAPAAAPAPGDPGAPPGP